MVFEGVDVAQAHPPASAPFAFNGVAEVLLIAGQVHGGRGRSPIVKRCWSASKKQTAATPQDHRIYAERELRLGHIHHNGLDLQR
jgi:hypothetical protein